jgi:sigma-B regulation protein RsbU (phosphoserine phosphatase)
LERFQGTDTVKKDIAFERLIASARALSSAVAIDELVDRILLFAQEVMQCPACSVLLADPATGDLVIHGTQAELKEQFLRVPAGKGIAGRVFRTHQPENTADAQLDAAHYGTIGLDTRTPAHGMLTIPLLDGEVCHGVMQALNPVGRDCFDDLDEEIFMAFGSLIATTLTRMKLCEAEQREKVAEAYRRAELTIAHQVLSSFMPAPAFQTAKVNIRVLQHQAAEVGGDFYAYHQLADGSILVVVGDASGKGVPAALESARACTLVSVKAPSCTGAGLPEWLGELNNVLHRTAERAGTFTAMTVVVIDSARRRLSVCTLGQPKPLFLSNDNRWEELRCACHPPLGMILVKRFQVSCFPLSIGSSLLLLTDGFIETRNARGEQFADGALNAALIEAANEGGDPLMVLEKRWHEFSDEEQLRDDATALLVTDRASRPVDAFECNLSPENIAKLRSYCEQSATFAGLEEAETYKVVLACDEILTNIYKHAYHCYAGPIRWSAFFDGASLRFVVVHWGDGLSCASEVPVLRSPPRTGGFGMRFIHKVFDDVKFERTAQCSTIILMKGI